MNFCHYAIAIICSLTLLSCGKSSDSSTPTAPVANAPTHSASPETSFVKPRTYQTNDGGCDSGKHSFSGSTQAEADQKYCAALQDEDLNRDHSPQPATKIGAFCPDTKRAALFKASCPGVFTAVYPKTDTSTPIQTASIAAQILKAKSLDEIAKILNLQNLNESSQYSEHALKDIAAALKAKINIITQSKNYDDQRLLLSFVGYRLSMYSDLSNLLVVEFMKSPDEELRTTSAATELNDYPTNTVALEIVRKGLSSKNADIRYTAVSSLGSFKASSFDDRISIIDALADSDGDVRSIALTSLQEMNLTNAYLQAISQILKNADADVRYSGATVAGQINTEASSQLLISQLSDKDSDVRSIIMSTLEQRSLNDNELEGLAKVLTNGNADSRYSAATLVGQINSFNSSQLLISHLGDSDGDVRSNVDSILSNRTLTSANLGALQIETKSSNRDTRYNAVNLVASIEGDRASEIIIDRLDDADSDVRSIASSALSNRKLGPSNLTGLVAKLNSANSDARYAAVGLIGSLNSPDGKAALRKRLSVERDSDVIGAIESVLQN